MVGRFRVVSSPTTAAQAHLVLVGAGQEERAHVHKHSGLWLGKIILHQIIAGALKLGLNHIVPVKQQEQEDI